MPRSAESRLLSLAAWKRELLRLDIADDAAELRRAHAEYVKTLARAGIDARKRALWEIYFRSAWLHDRKVLAIEYAARDGLLVRCEMLDGSQRTLRFGDARVEAMIIPSKHECVVSSVRLLRGPPAWRTFISLRAGAEPGGIILTHRMAPRRTDRSQ